MEEWQKQVINQNLPELVRMTKFDVDVKTKLIANLILTSIDVEQMDAERDRNGETAASYKYYNCLMTRVGAYEVLARILEENGQTGAARILKVGLRNLGILVEVDSFDDVQIDVQGKILKPNEFFATEKLELVHQIFRDAIPGLDFYDSFVKKKQTFVLATNSIPSEPPFYIPRFLSNRMEVDESILKEDCPDVFVFRNSISRYQLSEIVKPHSTDTSNSQLTKITCRFIYLDEFEDWYELKKKATVPIHLINYDTIQEIYLLEDTTAALEILSKIGSKQQRVYLSEDEFVQQQLSEKVSSVCICDTPGMGKTLLLSNIAREMSKNCTGTIVVFIQLSTFVADFGILSINTTKEQDPTLLNVFKYVSPSRQHAELLLNLVKAELLQVEIFFDGFDEIPSDKVEWMKQTFLSIKSKFQNVRIYTTSRPHIRHDLEKILDVIAYDIMPFNLQNQVDYLVRFWSPLVPELDQDLLSNYARYCLKQINETLTKDDKVIAGIPLLCRLIAVVYANKVQFYSTTGPQNIDFPLQIAAMYQQFVELRIRACAHNEHEFQNIKLVHMSLALKLIFPTDGFHDDEIFTEVNQMMASNLHSTPSSPSLRAGVMQFQSNSKLEFIHRTFAEYFVAEYFSRKLQSTTVKPKALLQMVFNTNDEITKVFTSIFSFPLNTDYSNLIHITFLQSVVVRFVDFSLNEDIISEEIISRLASFCTSISTKKFLSILCSCCNQNLSSLFSVLTKAVTKWTWFRKKLYFTTGNCFDLLSVCITESTGQMFRGCIQLLTEVLQLDLEKNCIFDRDDTLLHIAAKAANYEAVEYLLNRVSVELPTVLEKCVENSYHNDMDMIRRKENILNLVLNKNPTLIQGTPDILATEEIHLVLFKMLVKLGANLTAVVILGKNCAMNAAKYMSSSDFHELVQFLLNECKAEYLFLDHEKWSDPLPYIIRYCELLPETLELLLNIPGVDINMKDRKGDNLLFSSVGGKNVKNFQLLVNRGLDFNAIGNENRSLLHEAVYYGKLEMVQYLLSLGMDPNTRDKYEKTPLHYVAEWDGFYIAQMLLVNWADMLAKNIKGQPPLHFASKYKYEYRKKIMYLIGKGAEVNNRDNDGNTPLHLCKYPEIKECLLEMGADIHAKNKKGEIPTQIRPWLWE